MVCFENWCLWPETNEQFNNLITYSRKLPNFSEVTKSPEVSNLLEIARTFDYKEGEKYLSEVREKFEKYIAPVNVKLNWNTISLWQWFYWIDEEWYSVIYTAKHNLLFIEKGINYIANKHMLNIDWKPILGIIPWKNNEDLVKIILDKREKNMLETTNKLKVWDVFFVPWFNWNFELEFTWEFINRSIGDWTKELYNMAVFKVIWNNIDKVKWWDSGTPLISKDWKVIWIISASDPSIINSNKVYVTLLNRD